MNPNDKAMLEKVKPGWWATGRTKERWYLVVHVVYGRLYVWHEDHCQLQYISQPNITALHRPTDDPSMETAYLLGEPEEVTREEAENMVKSNWHWLLPDGQAIRHAIDVLPLEDIILMVETAYAIEAPGGNVYRIKD